MLPTAQPPPAPARAAIIKPPYSKGGLFFRTAMLFSCSSLVLRHGPGRACGPLDQAERSLAVADAEGRFVGSCVRYLEGLAAAPALCRCPLIDLLIVLCF
jgi:hypothetical protein